MRGSDAVEVFLVRPDLSAHVDFNERRKLPYHDVFSEFAGAGVFSISHASLGRSSNSWAAPGGAARIQRRAPSFGQIARQAMKNSPMPGMVLTLNAVRGNKPASHHYAASAA